MISLTGPARRTSSRPNSCAGRFATRIKVSTTMRIPSGSFVHAALRYCRDPTKGVLSRHRDSSPECFNSTSVMLHRIAFRFSLAVICGVLSIQTGLGQMQPHARFADQLLPILVCTDDEIIVVDEGRKHRTRDFEFEIRRGPGFADGMVQITDVIADRDPLRDAPLKKRTHPNAIRFRYTANLTADQSLVLLQTSFE